MPTFGITLTRPSDRMNIPRWALKSAALIAALLGTGQALSAQGITTGAIAGAVTGEQGQPVEGAQIQIVNNTTGYRTGVLTRANGSYRVQGLEIGGPYTVTARRIGMSPQTKTAIV